MPGRKHLRRNTLRATGGGRPLLSFEDLYRAEEVLVLGEDLQGEAPFAQAQLVRGQHQQKLHLTIAHPRRVKLARTKFGGDWLAVKPGSELALIDGLTRAALDLGELQGLPSEVATGLAALKQALAGATAAATEQATGVPAAALSAAAKRLREAKRKAILFGRALAEHPQAPALLQAVENLAWVTGALTAEHSSVMYMGPHSDSQGALDMGLTPDCLPGYVPIADVKARAAFEQAWGAPLAMGAGLSAPEILAAAAEGRIKALWIVGDQWLKSAPDRALAEQALARAELVIVNELFLTETAQRAHVVFPASAFAEKEGVVVNSERRLQKSVRALAWRKVVKPDWEIVQSVAQALGARWTYRSAEDVFREIAKLVPGYVGTSWATLLPLGAQWSVSSPRVPASVGGTSLAPAGKDQAPANGDGLWLLSGGTLFLQGSLSYRGALLPKLAKHARAYLHPDEAKRLGVADGAMIDLASSAGSVRLATEVDESVPAGSVFVPYAYDGVELNRLGMPPGAGLRVRAARVPAGEAVGDAVGMKG